MPTSPPGYIPPYTLDEVNERFVYLVERCARFLAGTKARHPLWNMDLDLVVMKNVAQSAMDDIWRYKVFHLADPKKYSDAVKRSAYFRKWLIKLRPIYHVRSVVDFKKTFDKKDSTLIINEAFALHISLGSLAVDVGVKRIALSPKFMGDILYDLHFRDMNGDTLIGMYQIIKDIAKKTSLVITS
jgi:hypothetical protein